MGRNYIDSENISVTQRSSNENVVDMRLEIPAPITPGARKSTTNKLRK